MVKSRVYNSSLAYSSKIDENEPSEKVHKQEIEPQVSIEVRSDSLPFEPEEAGNDRMLQKMTMLFALAHVP